MRAYLQRECALAYLVKPRARLSGRASRLLQGQARGKHLVLSPVALITGQARALHSCSPHKTRFTKYIIFKKVYFEKNKRIGKLQEISLLFVQIFLKILKILYFL